VVFTGFTGFSNVVETVGNPLTISNVLKVIRYVSTKRYVSY